MSQPQTWPTGKAHQVFCLENHFTESLFSILKWTCTESTCGPWWSQLSIGTKIQHPWLGLFDVPCSLLSVPSLCDVSLFPQLCLRALRWWESSSHSPPQPRKCPAGSLFFQTSHTPHYSPWHLHKPSDTPSSPLKIGSPLQRTQKRIHYLKAIPMDLIEKKT